MFSILKPNPPKTLLSHFQTSSFFLYTTTPSPEQTPDFKQLCNIVSNTIGGLDDLEASLHQSKASITPSLVTQVLDSCKSHVPSRRLFRFFTWSKKMQDIKDGVFNHAVRVFAEKKDAVALDILVSDLRKERRVMEIETFSLVAEALVKLDKEDAAVGVFKNLDKFNCRRDGTAVVAIVHALCEKGHAKKAEGVVWHHRSKMSGVEEGCVYKSILHGWCVYGNVKEARRVLGEMKSLGVEVDVFCYNTLLRCLCKRNLKFNPSALVPEACNVFVEMRSWNIAPTAATYNILLSCLGKTRRVKEAHRVLYMMKKSGCSPDWVSYYFVVRVMYLSGRFGKGNDLVDLMLKEELMPQPRFYHDLVGVLCGVERVGHALKLLDRMKKTGIGDYGPVYDLLIPKLCRGGEFEKGKLLWNEATEMGIDLQCSSDVLDPAITAVFKPVKKIEEVVKIGVKKKTVKKTKKRKNETSRKKLS